MNTVHKELAEGRWAAISWRAQPAHGGSAVDRMREALADYFAGGNTFRSTESQWRNDYRAFAYAARLGR